MRFRVEQVSFAQAKAAISQVRRAVFIEEQGIDPALEWDEYDQQARFVIALDESEQVIGTGRLLASGKIGRMAVLPAWRREGVGRAMLAALEEIAWQSGLQQVFLSAQVSACDFYRKQGYYVVGEAHEEAGLPHQFMEKALC